MTDKHKAFRHDGTGRTRAVTPATTPENARAEADRRRQNLPAGSSSWYEVREPKRK